MSDIPTDIYISGGSITIFLGSPSAELKNDILHSDLYSKLLAQQKGNDRELSWQNYFSTMSKLQWTIKSRETSRLEFGTTYLLKVLKQSGLSFSKHEIQTLSAAFEELKNLAPHSPASKALVAQLNKNKLTRNSTFVLITIIRQDNSISTAQISFESTDAFDVDTLISSPIRPINDHKNNIRLLTCHLSQQNSQTREAILKKLGSKIETELFHISTSLDLQ